MRDELTASGEQAAINIGLDVSAGPDARRLTGQVGTIEVSRDLPGTRRKWFGAFTSRPGSRTGTWTYGGWFHLKQPGVISFVVVSEYVPDPLPGRTGLIEHEYLEVDLPKLMRSRWGWFGRSSGQAVAVLGNARPVAPNTEVVITYRQFRDETGAPFTDLQLQHSGLPVEWLEDMTMWWTWQLDMAAKRASQPS